VILIVTQIKKDWTGMIDITVLVNGRKEYTFTLTSEQDLEEFERLRVHSPGRAFNFLKNNSKNYEKLLDNLNV
jgi:hypothetical protein